MITPAEENVREGKYRDADMDDEFGTPKNDDASNPSFSTDVSDEEGSITVAPAP